ncbi:MAG: hypothetical protein K0S25_821 [Bacillus sp. (in: firmicutes)]|jgi:integrative and conjugative element protein (TIGR02256 family)|nr:hypothetical protein [Sphingobacterium sp.]MDF2535431.1 hypothetical protein [Bacillales bacterium]MDF2791942.1 hypothetical protein [Neobacillus sp.]MDF2903183.1 hypothetical protein [Bacillus sp. (in: firmicutes)]
MISLEVSGNVIQVEDHILSFIKEKRQLLFSNFESGGMLLGCIEEGTDILVINDFTLPLKTDTQTRTRFIRNKNHNKLLRNKWIKSGGTTMYLGEWHTHPEVDPNYSSQDFRNWNDLLKKSNTFSGYLLFLISGTHYFKIWVGNRKNKKLKLVYRGEFD